MAKPATTALSELPELLDDEEEEQQQEEEQQEEQGVDYNKIYYTPYLGGKWADVSNNCSISLEDFDNTTHRMFVYGAVNVSSPLNDYWNSIKRRYYNVIKKKGVSEITFVEHYFAEQQYFHLLYDVDCVHNEDEYLRSVEYFNNLSQHLGKYSLCEYTNDEELGKKYNIEYNHDYHKYYSAHVVFYEKIIGLELIKQLFTTKKIRIQKNGKNSTTTVWVNDGIKYQDIAIWKELTRGKGRIMRHGIGNKVLYDHGTKELTVQRTATKVVDPNTKEVLPNHTQLITVVKSQRNSPQITKEELINCGIVFKEYDEASERYNNNTSRYTYTNKSKKLTTITNDVLKVITLNSDDRTLIRMSYEELEEFLSTIYVYDEQYDQYSKLSDAQQLLLPEEKINDEAFNGFVVNYELGNDVIVLLCHAAHVFTDKERLKDVVYRWYNRGNIHNTPNMPNAYVDTYYTRSPDDVNNRWFFSLLKHVNKDEDREKFRQKYAYTHMILNNLSINNFTSSSTKITFNKVLLKRYSIQQIVDEEERTVDVTLDGMHELINDLLQCVGQHNGVWYLLTSDGMQLASLDLINKQYLQKPFGDNVCITIADILRYHINKFTYTDVVFCSEDAFNNLPQTDDIGNKLRYINLFHGFNAIDKANKVAEGLVKEIVNLAVDSYDDSLNTYDTKYYSDDSEQYRRAINRFKQQINTDPAQGSVEAHYLLKDLSYIVNNVAKIEKVHHFVGLEGTCKGTLIKLLKFMDPYIAHNVTDINSIIGQNNAGIIEGNLIGECNEMQSFTEQRRNQINTFKAFITEDTVQVTQKYIVQHIAINRMSYFCFSNNTNTTSINTDDRRNQFHRCSAARKVNTSLSIAEQMKQNRYWEDVNKLLNDRFIINGIYHYIKHYNDDDKEYNPRFIINNEARELVIEATESNTEQWIKGDCNVYRALLRIESRPAATIKKLLEDNPPHGVILNKRSTATWCSNVQKYIHKIRDGGNGYIHTLLPQFVTLLKPAEYDNWLQQQQKQQPTDDSVEDKTKE